MALPDFLNDLNDSQREAVLCTDGPSLVIAGAGSGKTRVLTYKIAYLLTQGVKPWEIMALTFTNKAAKEMKERIAALVGEENARYLRMGTFHSVFASILRHEANKIGYNSNYTIYDEADSRSLIKSIVKEMGLDDKVYKPADIHCRISDAKNHLITACAYAEDFEALQRDAVDGKPKTSSIYIEYARRLLQSNAMDFDDLLLNIWMLFKNDEQARLNYSGNFRYILVDEYQDTNHAQQEIVFQLTSVHNNVCVVGDDAQSIYGFRGANIDNILNFQHLYAGAKLFKLEQNYRSTHSIVDAANSLIHNNTRQIPKEVYSMGDKGEPIVVTGLSSDREEAIFVSRSIRERMRKEGLSYSDFAILYRTNYQSRIFEEEFMKSAMPYRIYGGMSFYQRKEIKDIIAYFRLVVNPYDEEALERIINYPARKIGGATLAKLHEAARKSNKSSLEILEQGEQAELDVNKGTMTKLIDFRNLIMTFAERLDKDDAYTLGKQIIRESGISNDIYSGKDSEHQSKQEHLVEFMTSMYEFTEAARDQENPMGLTDFLQDVSLLSDREEEDGDSPKITLMTIHSAKGLEFPCVYVVGMEEDIFPSKMSQGSMRRLEEERRLLYVAITRAEQYCHLTYAKTRFRYGSFDNEVTCSRFLRDINLKYVNLNGKNAIRDLRNAVPVTQQRNYARHSMPMSEQKAVSKTGMTAKFNFNVGDNVTHERFGKGVITTIIGEGNETKAVVDFANAGERTLMLKFARLTKV